MPTSLLDIRFMIERQIKPVSLDNADIVDWCNEANGDFGLDFNLPKTEPIALNSTDLEYQLPADLKVINRLRLQSIVDDGVDREFGINYRINAGKIIFPRPVWTAPDTLLVDYYKHLAVFTDVEDEIELDDRYAPIYVFYGLVKYYEMPESFERYGEQNARMRMQSNQVKYQNMKSQLTNYQMLSNEPVIIDGRWR